jgi:BirA family biotin operon repressor/biotin-[acetyl-CoA-carboxylase] ligase
MSIVLKPDLPPQETPVLNLILSLAVADALCALGVKAETRWPNDVLIRGKKVAGILAEADFNRRTNWVVVGIGINTNVEIESFPEDFRDRATSLKRELGREIDNSKLIGRILQELDRDYRRLREGYLHEILDEWKRHARMMGRRVKIRTKDELLAGTALDIGRDGSLSIRTDSAEVRCATVGECSLSE